MTQHSTTTNNNIPIGIVDGQVSSMTLWPFHNELPLCIDSQRLRLDVDIDRRRIDQLLLGGVMVTLAAFAVIPQLKRHISKRIEGGSSQSQQ